jgi:cytochrome c-type biogenesis protein
MRVLAAVPAQNLYLLVAFGGGVISFLSPCVLPIVPAYLSLVTGLSVGELQEADQSHYLKRIAVNTGMFVAGFTVVFVVLSLVFTALGSALFRNQETLTKVSGGLLLLMAAYLAGSQLLTTPGLYREFRFHPHLERFGPVAAPIAGAAFGLAWTPCIGPVLGAVLTFATNEQDVGRSTALLIAYSLGLGLPFLAVGLAMGKLTHAMDWCKRHSRAITFVSAAILAVFGVVLLTDQLPQVTARLTDTMRDNGLGWLLDLG